MFWPFQGTSNMTFLFDKRLPFGAQTSPVIFHRLTLSYLSKEYHDLNDFRTAVKKELQRLGKCESELALRVDNVAKAIDEFQAYSYRYNIKIVGLPEKGTNESADETSRICVALFREMGTDVSINDIDTAHRVPGRNNSSQDPRPKPIICKFVCRLARDKVMAK